MRASLTQAAIVSLLIAIAPIFCVGQSTENIQSTFKDGRATITYDLVGVPGKELYAVDIYSSHDNFGSPLKLVSGAVGKNIRAGKGKKIEWEAAQEAPNYNESITFRIKTDWMFTPTVQPIVFTNPTRGFIRRGRAIIIEWKGGISGSEKDLELYRGTELVATIHKNTIWTYTWTIPSDLKKGKGYTFRLTGPGETGVSNEFKVKSKIPLLLKLSPVIVAAAIIPFLGGSKSEKGLPNAPLPE